MGTRSLTRVNTKEGKQYINMYRQYDGYPSGHGQELFDFLKDMKIVNGYNGDMKAGTHANGLGCLSAQMIGHFKNGELGGIYIYPVELTDCGQDYEYIVSANDVKGFDDNGGDLSVKVISYGNVEFEGSVSEFGAWINKPEPEED